MGAWRGGMALRCTGRAYLFVLLVLLWGPVPLSRAEEAAAPVGSVVAIRGSVTAVDVKGETRTLAIKSPLYLDDTVNTGKRGRLQILFTDNSVISLGRNSVVKIAKYAWDPDKDKAEISTEVKEGVFRVMGGLISKKAPDKFETETPVATIGIRGSMYAGTVSATQGLTVVFEGGKGINLSNGTGTIAITSPGFGSQVRDWNAAIPKPAKVGREAIRGLRQELALRGAGPERGQGAAHRSGRPNLPVTFGKGEIGPPTGGAAPQEGKPEQQGEPRGEQPAGQEEITAAVKENPAEAVKILQNAVAAKVNVEQALGAVLAGMQNVDKQSFESLINQAIEMGLTPEGAKKIAEQIKASGGGCQ